MKLNPSATGFLFPGQGSQTVGMGQALAASFPIAAAAFQEADSILGVSLSTIMWTGTEAELNDTVNTQPALFVHSLAAFKVFENLYPTARPAAVAGHSLGELSAFAAAGVFSFEDGLLLVRKRGELMKLAGERMPGSMAAILNLDIPALEKVCAEASTAAEPVQVANDNCPGQVVISGSKPAVERAMLGAKAAGAKRAIPLAVSIAAHSGLMASIQDEWNDAVNGVAMQEPNTRIIGNVRATVIQSVADARTDIQMQMQSRVRWTESIEHMAQKGASAFVEVGSGNVLQGLGKRIAPAIPCYPLGNPGDFSALE